MDGCPCGDIGTSFWQMGRPRYKGQSQFVASYICMYVSSSHKMDSCAIKKDENLLDAADIEWFNDADDAHLLPPTSSEVSRWSRDSVPIAVPEVLRGLLPSIEHPDSCS